MRLSTDEERDEQLALETIAAAAGAGITVFDTARAYARGEAELGHNERLLARALRRCGAAASARIVTKGGMARADDGWRPDGRAKAIRRDCEASLAALDGLPIDLYLIHAPDPRTPWRTSVRALTRLLDDGLVRDIGLSNVNRRQLDEALDLAPVAAVQVALSPYDDRALRGGVVERCAELDIWVLAHSPLGGPRRARALGRNPVLARVASSRGATPAEVALAWLLDLSAAIVPIPGARRPETARVAARAARCALDEAEREALARAFCRPPSTTRRRRRQADGEVVLVMGIPGAGKSRVAEGYVGRDYVRLNRDERGGSLRGLADTLEEELAGGAPRVVLDNTYLTRAARSHVVEAAARHGLPARCVWLDTPLAQAQVNLVERMLDRLGSLPGAAELRALARREPGILAPTSQMRALRELEPPSLDEGWSAVERIPFERVQPPLHAAAVVLVAAAALTRAGWSEALAQANPEAPHLVYDWRPDAANGVLAYAVRRIKAEVSGPVESAVCPHPAGPPTCWCRPPLPGLALAFLRPHRADWTRSALVGTSRAHRALASALGARYVEVPPPY
jgi:aryl-alcohol dehydrogenase-like predicted oxidoreductase